MLLRVVVHGRDERGARVDRRLAARQRVEPRPEVGPVDVGEEAHRAEVDAEDGGVVGHRELQGPEDRAVAAKGDDEFAGRDSALGCALVPRSITSRPRSRAQASI